MDRFLRDRCCYLARKLRGVPLDVHASCPRAWVRALSVFLRRSVCAPAHAPSDSGAVGAEGSVTDVGRAALDELEKRRKGSTTGVSVVTIGCFWTNCLWFTEAKADQTLRTHILWNVWLIEGHVLLELCQCLSLAKRVFGRWD